MGKFVGFALSIALACAAFVASAGATTVPQKTALIYGDSLVWESYWEINNVFVPKKAWTAPVNHSYPGTSPCDWLARLPADLAAYHPATVTLATAGNASACMSDPIGSDGYLAQYRADLRAIFAAVTATGARMVFVEDPPFGDLDASVRNPAVVQIIAIATELAGEYPGVSIVKSARSQLSKNGAYVAYKPCLTTETAAMGCANGQIAIRTVSGDPLQIGLHLCPPSLPTFPWFCPVYSSGEYRFGKVVGDAAASPPRPIVPASGT